jgi:protein-S-isoprenylcysteine O-methyltransferase Ste14
MPEIEQPTRSSALDARVPPLIVMLAIAGAMWTAIAAMPSARVPIPLGDVVGWSLGAVGTVVVVAGLGTFLRFGTTADPMNPGTASRLVTSGIYARTRNPMYVGMTMVLVGFAIARQHPIALALASCFPAYVGRFQIPPEERAMTRLFGSECSDYMKRVPRWL